MTHRGLMWLGLAALWGCATDVPAGELGALSLALTAQAGGADYRLAHARFALEGGESRALTADAEAELTVELRAGAYTLTLLDGWALERLADGGASAGEVSARLVSENPLRFEIAPATSTHAALRFELVRDGPTAATGTLTVALEVDASGGEPACEGALRITELDYEQPGPDEAEFIEVVNSGTCTAPLDGVTLELVNGGDGQSYGRYELAEAGDGLAAGERLLVADAALLHTSAAVVLPLRASGLQNGPDGVKLVRGGVVLDALAYGGVVAGVGEGAPAPDDTGEQALSRCPGDFDSDSNELDFRLSKPTPGTTNACE